MKGKTGTRPFVAPIYDEIYVDGVSALNAGDRRGEAMKDVVGIEDVHEIVLAEAEANRRDIQDIWWRVGVVAEQVRGLESIVDLRIEQLKSDIEQLKSDNTQLKQIMDMVRVVLSDLINGSKPIKPRARRARGRDAKNGRAAKAKRRTPRRKS